MKKIKLIAVVVLLVVGLSFAKVVTDTSPAVAQSWRVKVCSAVVPGNWRDSTMAPDDWYIDDCYGWAQSVGGTETQLGCFFDDGYS
ncbi:hypothetical protein HJG54_23810 [Leptolyngbya sp. NK1-12]|uniref:Uncharacterized protein n=1 Tax=Leptolyngbya sp. NK1-12 TaxID=2547451 RepID=A0AA96WNZ7_9CYAN|nr:hypothetical protein [Leptolyngbya sp. NK1-12]WNZ25571.1 hypothetical protein HJG54_23810 [Leptolyngbya sp. NK1-12]